MFNAQTRQQGRQILVFDPIHQVMQLPATLKQPIQRIIDTPLFQRLRSIRQMGMADMVFPSATHTRFLHALGACFLALRIGTLLELEEANVHRAALAGLLHDIGHGPLSHAFEAFLNRKLGYKVAHEKWTPHFIEAGMQQYGWLADFDDPDTLKQDLVGFINGDHRENPDAFPGEAGLVGDIISSQLDADRLDYLLRDSHFCGVSYGAIDMEWLLYCMVPVEMHGTLRLGINEKGIGVAEEFFMARRLMYRNIYYHKRIMAFEKVLIEFLLGLCDSLIDQPKRTRQHIGQPLADFLSDIDRFRQLDAPQFMEEKFASYSLLRDYDLWLAVRSVAQAPQSHFNDTLRYLGRCLEEHGEPIMVRVAPDKLDDVEATVAELKSELHEDAWKVDMQKIKFGMYSTDGDHPVVSSRGHGHAQGLGMLSDVISLLGDRLEPAYYLMVDAELYRESRWKSQIEECVQRVELLR